MDKFSLKIHSLVDVITNSSSVIYTKELIQEILKGLGDSRKVEDLLKSIRTEEMYE